MPELNFPKQAFGFLEKYNNNKIPVRRIYQTIQELLIILNNVT
jgi:hypothetical protein